MAEIDHKHWNEVADEHELIAKYANEKHDGAGDYDKGVAEGIRMVLRG